MIPAKALEAVTPVELSRASALFGTLKQLRIKLKNADESVLDRAFELHVQGVLEKLENRLPTLIDAQLRNVEVTMAKHGLYDAAFQQVIILCQSISPALGDSLKDLRSIHSGFMTNLQESVENNVNERSCLLQELVKTNESITKLEDDIITLQTTITQLDNEAEGQQKKILELRHYLREAAQEINLLRSNGSASQSNNSKLTSSGSFNFTAAAVPVFGGEHVSSPKPTSSHHQSLQRSASNVSIMSTNTFNNGGGHANSPHYAASLKKSDLAASVFNFDAIVTHEDQLAAMGNGSAPTGVSLAGSPSNRSLGGISTLRGSTYGGGLNTPSRSLSVTAPVNWLHVFRLDVQKAIDDGRCREITLHECKETMERIYESKAIANDKAIQGIGNLPMETLEQHTYRSMEKKYGLRNLAVEHAGMLFRALERYGDEDNEVSVFQRIFRNEVEEDFRLIQGELLKSIRELALVQLMGKYPTKDQGTLHNLLDQRMSSGVINEEEWKDMVNYLYNTTDSTSICVLLKRLAVDLLDAEEDPLVASLSINTKPNVTTYVIGTNGTKTSATAGDKSELGYNQKSGKDVKRLGYSSPTLKVSMKSTAPKSKKELLKLPFALFVKTILDFQLRSHQQYLSAFLRIFRNLDRDVDGVLNANEFHECFLQLRKTYTPDVPLSDTASTRSQSDSEVMNSFVSLIKSLDPNETDRIIYSSAVSCLSKLHSKG